MGLLDWLRSSDNPDAIETLLKHLAEQTSDLEARQHTLMARRDSVSLMITMHGCAAYLVYLVLLYLSVLPSYIPHWAILSLWPVLVFSLRSASLKFFGHRLRSTRSALENVRKRQTAEIEKLKKQTRYDETRALIERLESPKPQQQPQQQPGKKMPRKSMPASLSTPQLQQQSTPPSSFRQHQGRATPGSGSPAVPPLPQQYQQQQQEVPQSQSGTPSGQRNWVDRVAEALLGDQEGTSGSQGAQRGQYALICGQCFNHNGLVLKEDLPYTQYNCPKCGHFNPPKKLSKESRPSNMLEVPSALRTRRSHQDLHSQSKPPTTATTMSSSATMPSFKSVQPQSDSEEEEEEEAVDSMMKTSASDVDLVAHEGVRQRPITRSAAKRSGLSKKHDQEEEEEEEEESE